MLTKTIRLGNIYFIGWGGILEMLNLHSVKNGKGGDRFGIFK